MLTHREIILIRTALMRQFEEHTAYGTKIPIEVKRLLDKLHQMRQELARAQARG